MSRDCKEQSDLENILERGYTVADIKQEYDFDFFDDESYSGNGHKDVRPSKMYKEYSESDHDAWIDGMDQKTEEEKNSALKARDEEKELKDSYEQMLSEQDQDLIDDREIRRFLKDREMGD